MSADKPTIDELKTLILATGGEIESITDTLADEVQHMDLRCAERIRSIGAQLTDELRTLAGDLGGKPPN